MKEILLQELVEYCPSGYTQTALHFEEVHILRR
jgi:hypothetical protein